VEKLMMSPGIRQWYELSDFYHAVGHLNKIADMQKGWKKTQKKRRITKYRRLLLKGKTDEVTEAVRQICRGKKSKKLRTERDYFIPKNCRLQYSYYKYQIVIIEYLIFANSNKSFFHV
jgi:RNA polymerase-interacting CarD/CdnL/TRCF family regulator